MTHERPPRHQPAHLDHRRPARSRRRDAASRPASPRRGPRASKASSSAASSRARRRSSRRRSRRTDSRSSRAGTARTCSSATRRRSSRRCARIASSCRRSAAKSWSWSRRRRAASTATARTRLSQRPVLAPADWPQFAERLDELGARLQDSGLTLAYHHHMGTVVQTEDEVDRLMDSCDDDGRALLLDTGHLTFAGGDPVRAATRHAERIAHVHCKDVRRAGAGAEPEPRLELPRRRARRRLHGARATAAWTTRPCSRRSRARSTAAGSSSRRSRTRPSRPPPTTPNLGYRNLRRFADAMASP